MAIYGYMLENTNQYLEINNQLLIKLLNESNVNEENIYIDKIEDYKRPSLRELNDLLKAGDLLIVRSLSDLCNNIKTLEDGLKYFNKNHISLISAVESYYTYESYYQALIDFSRYETFWREQKRLSGIEKATAEKRMGRKKNVKKIDMALKMIDAGVNVPDVADTVGISKSTIYRELANRKM